jgi:hypothetical protein
MTKRKFYRTIVKVEVLSEDEVSPAITLERLGQEIVDGDWSGEITIGESVKVDGKKMAALLEKQGSDPSFFRLTPTGEDSE